MSPAIPAPLSPCRARARLAKLVGGVRPHRAPLIGARLDRRARRPRPGRRSRWPATRRPTDRAARARGESGDRDPARGRARAWGPAEAETTRRPRPRPRPRPRLHPRPRRRPALRSTDRPRGWRDFHIAGGRRGGDEALVQLDRLLAAPRLLLAAGPGEQEQRHRVEVVGLAQRLAGLVVATGGEGRLALLSQRPRLLARVDVGLARGVDDVGGVGLGGIGLGGGAGQAGYRPAHDRGWRHHSS